MATTVIEAFNKFLADQVNLCDDETKIARASRDWLVGQICNFPSKVDHFPQVYTEKNIFFGSFARNTKKRPLDDIDIMICLNAQGSTYFEGLLGGISISVPEQSTQLRRLCNDGTDLLMPSCLIWLWIRQDHDQNNGKSTWFEILSIARPCA